MRNQYWILLFMASLFPHLLWVLVLQLPLFTTSQTHQNVTLGSSLSTLDSNNPSWNSPSGEFSFGFRPTVGKDLFLLAIWFDKIPEKTIIWTGNGGEPVQRGSTVQLTSNGALSLFSPNRTVVWKAESLSGERVASSAAMLNSGNFVLTSNDSTTVWQSFENPTDTLLPTQTLDLGDKLTSRLNEEDYTPGRFELILRDDRNLVLRSLARPTESTYTPYWSSNTPANGSQVVFDQSGSIYLALINRSQFNLTSGTPVSTSDLYHRATLDFDGVFRQYTYPKSSSTNGSGSQSWSTAKSIPEDICVTDFGEFGSGVCGLNSYCKLERERPTCVCPPGYIYSDQSNTFGGCKQNFVPPSCGADKLRMRFGYEMRQIPSTNWPRGDYEWFKPVTEDWCRERCLDDCLCAAAITREGNCWLKKFPLSNGRLEPGTKAKALIKVGNSSTEAVPFRPPFGQNKNDRNKWIIPGSILLGSSACLNLLLLLSISLFIYCVYYKKKFKIMPDTSTFGMNLRSFSYKELEEATDGFKEELGKGAFSTVYKGRLQSATTSFVAVKRLDKVVKEVDKEFKTELSAIGQTNHKNLVKLLGFCDERTNRLLVYEFMRNGTLADLLFGSLRPDWCLRIEIAFGIARGLAYLHEDCSTQIIHCDVKPQNILLDDSLTAKISDFGLAKLLKSDQSRTNTAIRGTRGYVAPEWFNNMAITAKVDVYSFGIMLLEIICCRRNVTLEAEADDIDILSDWAYQCCAKRNFPLLVEKDEEARKDSRRLARSVMVAFWCMQEDPSLRPSMKKVTQMLEGAVEVSMPPDPSASPGRGRRRSKE